MNSWLREMIEWSEVWGPLIPLIVLLIVKKTDRQYRSFVLYVLLGFIINTGIIVIAKFKNSLSFLPDSNHLLYHIHSFIRVILFCSYIYLFRTLWSHRLIRFIIPAYLLFTIINFTFLESPFVMGKIFFAVEGILLLGACIAFFLSTIQDDSNVIWMHQPVFLICAGISLYEAINFIVFLFFYIFNVTAEEMNKFGALLLTIFSVTYVLLCIMFAFIFWKGRIKRNEETYELA